MAPTLSRVDRTLNVMLTRLGISPPEEQEEAFEDGQDGQDGRPLTPSFTQGRHDHRAMRTTDTSSNRGRSRSPWGRGDDEEEDEAAEAIGGATRAYLEADFEDVSGPRRRQNTQQNEG